MSILERYKALRRETVEQSECLLAEGTAISRRMGELRENAPARTLEAICLEGVAYVPPHQK